MNALLLAHALVFGLAALACFVAVLRARRVDDHEVRYGLVGLLVGSGVWAASHTGLFLLPSVPLKRGVYLVGLIFGFSTVWAWLYFCSAYTGRVYHRSSVLRRASLVVYLGVVAVKLTNPLHELYFTAELVGTPFRHLEIQQGLFHWTVTGLSYALAAVGLFVLFETFLRADYDTRALGVLATLTGVPAFLDVVAYATPPLVDVIYAPLGVAVFTVGVLYVYDDRFFAVGVSGGREDPTLVLDSDGRIRDYNDAAVRLFEGVPGSVGEPLESVVPRPPEPPGERTDGGAPIVPVEVEGDTRYYVESRDRIAIGDDSLGEVVTYTDVTRAERRRRELEATYERLERERDRFANLFEYLPDPVNEVEFVDDTPRIRAVNPAFEGTFGYDADRLVDADANEVITPAEDGATTDGSIDRRARDGEVVTEEVRRQTAEGVRDFLFRGIPYGSDGNVRALGVYTDITDQKRRQRRLRVLNRVLRHNVRNEMTVVNGYAELLADELDDGPLSDPADELLSAAREVTEISEQARAVEKAVQRTPDDPVDLAAVVGSVVEPYRQEYPGIDFETVVEDDLHAAPTGGIRLAVENLVENSVEHGSTGSQNPRDSGDAVEHGSTSSRPKDDPHERDPGPERGPDDDRPTVRVEVERDGPGWAVIRVGDEGPGIPAHERAVVAGDREVSQLEHGSGLGLWIVRWVVESAGGEVRFADAEGGGATVELRVPTAEDAYGSAGD
jgi:PAS domain S-box-containing protein